MEGCSQLVCGNVGGHRSPDRVLVGLQLLVDDRSKGLEGLGTGQEPTIDKDRRRSRHTHLAPRPQVLFHLASVRYFVLTPYGMGEDNDEALQSGAFWFYRKLGFRAANPEVEALAVREEAQSGTDSSPHSPGVPRNEARPVSGSPGAPSFRDWRCRQRSSRLRVL